MASWNSCMTFSSSGAFRKENFLRVFSKKASIETRVKALATSPACCPPTPSATRKR
jgi:hypothetical protein